MTDSPSSDKPAPFEWTPEKRAAFKEGQDEARDTLYRLDIEKVTAEHNAAEDVIKRLRRVIESDRTDLCRDIERLKQVIASRQWLKDGRGPYEWDDEKYQAEFAEMIDEVNRALRPLEDIARSHSDCPQSYEEVQAARGTSSYAIMDVVASAHSVERAFRLGMPVIDRLALLAQRLKAMGPYPDLDPVPSPALASVSNQAPVPMLLRCDYCHMQHLDEGEWATKPHRTHACLACGRTWRPALVPTVGVLRLPNVALGAQS